jgi:ubiquinone/menaquinone biosynthesis C-methylase UbiE
MSILELGAGTGELTQVILKKKCKYHALDISPTSLEVLKVKFIDSTASISIHCADIESLPFNNNSFDMIVCAGSLSYGDNNKVRKEIIRVLTNDGIFICVDSLHHNPVYVIKRYIDYFLGDRTISTIRRMPKLNIIKEYRDSFKNSKIAYFGAFTWILAPLARVFGQHFASRLSSILDQRLKIKKNAFKFVMCLKNKK